MFFRRPSIRRFEYLPRYYDPEKDPAEKFKQRFERQRHSRSRPQRSILRWMIVFLLAVYAYLYLAGLLRS
ncbi:MAG: hypothetical protein HBSIN02_23900 [Bacteroidia bacterium]|nr:MAG: hypothetical protein HBSIN02_23900 [Bacteroidia bacterium]